MTPTQRSYRELRESTARWADKDVVVVANVLTEYYRGLSPARQAELDVVIREWLHSNVQAERYDALGVVRQLGDLKFVEALSEMHQLLPAAPDVLAAYEARAVQRVLAMLTRHEGR